MNKLLGIGFPYIRNIYNDSKIYNIFYCIIFCNSIKVLRSIKMAVTLSAVLYVVVYVLMKG